MPKRPSKKYFKTGGYSTDFTPKRGAGRRYLLDRIPADFWTAVRAKAKAEKTSLRALILRLLAEWLRG
jgi:hypothetical protein